ncbi:hypothetical protein EDD85DRAFT_937371 [Armillaria nabsnona]|nr:hypothetical protein EDD85DRAFT_937371 [Armillaria nabsnona]
MPTEYFANGCSASKVIMTSRWSSIKVALLIMDMTQPLTTRADNPFRARKADQKNAASGGDGIHIEVIHWSLLNTVNERARFKKVLEDVLLSIQKALRLYSASDSEVNLVVLLSDPSGSQ